MGKIYFYLMLLLSLFLAHQGNCQELEYDSYKAIKSNPLDSISLSIVESDTSQNFFDLYTSLISYCALNRTDKAKKVLIELSEYGFKIEYIKELLTNRGLSFDSCIGNDSGFLEEYGSKEDEFVKRNSVDTVSRLINEYYDLDQTARRIYRISSNKTYVKKIDSINMEHIESWLNNNQIESKRIGVKLEEKLYIMMLHNFRYIPQEKFVTLSGKLLELVHQDKFHPIYYANIVDERLRVNGSKEYPKFNYLRKIKVNEDKQAEIETNRRIIDAY